MAYIATLNGKDARVKVEESQPGLYRVRIGDQEYPVDFFQAQENVYSLIIDQQSYEVDIDEHGNGSYSLLLRGEHFAVQLVDERKKKLAEKRDAGATKRQQIKSPMAGNIWKVLKNQGESVKAGEVLIILEAMKMENEIRSPIDGVVSSMDAVAGNAVSAGAPLCLVDPALQQ